MSKFVLFSCLISSTIYASEFSKDIVLSLTERTTHTVIYDGSYTSISYPNGDVPENKGVCTDVIIRAYRQIGTDSQ